MFYEDPKAATITTLQKTKQQLKINTVNKEWMKERRKEGKGKW